MRTARDLRRRLVLFAVVSLIAGAVGIGCSSTKSSGADGSTCASSTDCTSHSCIDGTCAGRACDPSASSATQCDPGWACFTDETSTLGFDQTITDTCVPLCGVCPSTEHCPLVGGETISSSDADSGVICASGPPLSGTIDGPTSVAVGATVTFTVSFENGKTFDVVNWFYATGSGAPQPLLGSAGTQGPMLVTQFSEPAQGGERVEIWAQGIDVNRSTDPTLPSAEVAEPIDVLCMSDSGTCE